MTTAIRFLVAVCCIVAAIQARAADLKAVRDDWKVDLARYDNLVVKFVTHASVKSGADVSTQENKVVAKRLGPNRLAYFVQKPTTLNVANEKYFFVATESARGGWTLGTYGQLTEENVVKLLKRLDALCGDTPVHYSIGNIPLYPNLDAFRVDSETDDVLTLTSTRDLESNDGMNKVRLSDIKLQLDKKNHFQLVGATCMQHINNSLGKLTVVYKTDHSTDQSQQSTITMTETYGAAPSELKIESTTQYEFQFQAGLKESDFRLTAYGLPEPSDVVWERPTPVYIWLLAAAGGLAVLALVFRWLFKRRQPAPAAA